MYIIFYIFDLLVGLNLINIPTIAQYKEDSQHEKKPKNPNSKGNSYEMLNETSLYILNDKKPRLE
jgi:hypothetical protein